MKTSTIVSQLIKKVALSCLILLAINDKVKAQISVSGGTGLSASYTSLTKSGGLFEALNSSAQTGNSIVINITSDVTSEDGTNSLNAGAWTSITISPSGARTISGSVTGILLNLNGADNVTIDGLNAAGNSLTISNTATGASNTIRFINDASNNTITNCIIQGSASTAANAVVNFSTGTTSGNDNNTISNCDITAAGSNLPVNGIFSLGTSASIDNNGNTISGNKVYDFFSASLASSAISVGATGNNAWTISNNKIYQTATRTYTTGNTHQAIFIGGGDGYTVSGNTIGYSSSSSTGTYTMTGTGTTRFIGIGVTVGTTVTSSIQGNTVSSINLTSANPNGTTTASFVGISVLAGNVNIGTTTGNIIGATSGLNSIVLNTTISGAGSVGIYCGSTGTLNLSNNKIGAMTDTGATATFQLHLYGIYIGAVANSITISNCTIGNSTANNMYVGRLGFTSVTTSVAGIAAVSTSTSVNFTGDTIQNLASNGGGTGFVRGIYTAISGSTTAATINNNTIRNLTTANGLTGISNGNVVASGISFGAGLNSTIYKNTIYNISCSNTGTGNYVVAGIAQGSAQGVYMYGNTIYNLSNAGTGTTAATPPVAAGIAIRSGGGSGGFENIYNNMISLGAGQTSNTCFIGIWANHGLTPDPVDSIYHNSISIEGTVTSGALSSFCFNRGALSTTAYAGVVNVKNNIFTNSRTGGTGGHYAISNNFGATGTTTGWVSNNNILNSANTATVGYHAAGAKTFAAWQSAMGDANSYTAATVTYTNSATANLHINMGTAANQIESQGDATVGISTDFDGDVRPGPVGSVNGGAVAPDLGADEWDGTIVYNCITNATPNTVVANPTSVSCNGATVTLSLGTTVTTTGNTYQWQYSTDNTNWSNIVGAVSSSYVATVGALNNYYRCGITCANGGGAIYSTSSGNVTGVAPLAAGTYTINSGAATGGTNYNTFTAAFADLACKGISGAVVFNVLGGPFVEQPVLNSVTGASATNTITINGNGRTLSFSSSTSATRSGIILNGADYVTIDDLIIDGSAGTYGWGVLLTNGADYNTISNCAITVSSTNTTSTNHYGIVISASTTTNASGGVNGSYNTFTGNTITGGYYGISMYGNSTASLYNQGNTVTNNIIRNANLYSVYAIYQKNLNISGNDISRPTRTTTGTTAGVYLTTGGGGNIISKNRIHNMFDAISANSSTTYGIYCGSDGASGTENIISNNIISLASGLGTATVYGLYNTGAPYMLAYHNTIVISDASSTSGATYGLYQTTAAAGLQYKNNIVYVTRGGTGIKRCVYYVTTTSGIVSNNNNFYLNSAGGTDNNIGQWGTTIFATLNNWKTANSNAYDANSSSVNPQFLDATNNDYTPNSGAMDNLGTYVGISTDIDGNSRDNTTPDMGAIEFTGAGCQDPPTPGNATSSSTFACPNISFNLDVVAYSSGVGNTFQWQMSSDSTNWTDIGTSQTTTSYTTSQTTAHYYRVGITCSGGTTVYSSFVYVNTPTSISGTYTINKNAAVSSTNFQSIASAIDAMGCGINGAVIFNIVAGSGPYNEQVTIPAITGASATNTITFNGNGNTLSFNSIASATRVGITLNGADYITINNLNIDGSAGTYGWGILFINGADYNTISNCNITVSTSNTTSTNHYPIVFSASATTNSSSGVNGSFNTITNNTLTGGHYGISMYGSSTVASYNQGNTITNNIISDAYAYSIYAIYQKNATIAGNDISRPTRASTTTAAGLYFTTGGGGNIISKNKIHNMFDAITANTSTVYGMYVAADGASGTENVISNNIISLEYGLGTGSVYGLYNSGADYMQAYHNTIVIGDATSTSGLATGFYQTTAVSGLAFKNNIVRITRGGSGIKRCINLNTTTTELVSNNNNFYLSSAGGTDNNIGEWGTVIATTISDWKTVNSSAYDANSVSVNPIFIDTANNDYTPNSGAMDNLGVNVGITTDINGNSRSNTTPDMGAIEFTGAGCTSPPTAGDATSSTTFACSGITFNLDVANNSFGVGQTYQWQTSTDSTNWSNVGSSQIAASYSTTQTAPHYYRVAVTCGGVTMYSKIVYVNTIASINGTYTINKNAPASSTNFQSISSAINAMGCGITGAVVFNVVSNSGPYNEQITIPSITGASATNTVTFNGNGNTIYNKLGTSASRAGITLDDADYVTVNNFTINVADSTYGWGVWFTNGADYNTISNCNILTSTIETANHYPIVFSGSATSATTSGNNGNYNTVTGCNLVGGAYNVSLYGNSTTGSENTGNTISNNIMTDAYIYTMYVLYQKNLTIRGNNISRPTRTASSTIAGMYLSTSSGGGYLIEKNIIHNMNDMQPASTSTCYGIYMAADASSYTNPNRVQNNLIYNLGGNGPIYGVYNSGGEYEQIYHNTIVLNDNTATSGTAYGIYQTTAANVDIRNNNILVSRTGTGIKRCLHFATTTSTIICDYNNLIMDANSGTDNNIGTFGTTAYATLTDWKAANTNAYDQHSYSISSSFADVSSGNYKPTSLLLDNKGTNVGVTKDLLDSTRSTTTPDIGAYEFDIPTCSSTPTAGTTIINASIICSGNSLNLDLSGNSTGIGITYQWQYSTDNSNWNNLTGVRSAASLDTTQTITRYYRAAVSCNNGTPSYSTVVFATTPALVSGTFTINSGQATGGTNFQTFTDAVSYISCGVSGPVVFNVAAGSGPYNEQITIPVINGASATNTITFNGNGRTLSFNSASSANRAVITLNGADYITINNLVINATSGTYGWGVFFTGAANYNTVSNCTINVSTTNSTSGNHNCIVMSGSYTSVATSGNNGNYNTITNNTLNGGYYVIAMYGSSTANAQNVGNVISNNTIKDAYSYCIYALYQSGALITGNDISRPTRASSTSTAGVFLSTGDINCTVSKNRIHNMFDAFTTPSTSINYSIYVAGDGVAGQENKIINNLVYNITSNGTQYGIYNTAGAYMRAYHNTIVLDDPTTTTTAAYGIYQTSAAAGIEIKNNNIYVTRGGTGIKRCLHFVTTTSGIISNNNNLFLSAAAGTDNNIGTYGTTAYATLTNWKTANSSAFDQNSISVNPAFANVASGNYLPTDNSLNIGANVGVVDDIMGAARTSNYTVGAYQIDFIAPTITYTALSTDCGPSQSTSRTLSGVVISDPSGVPTNGSTVPRIYYKKGVNGSWNSAAGTFSSTWSFTINYASISGLANGDSIYYYVVAQDLSSVPNVGSSPSGAVGANVNSIVTHPAANYFRAITYVPSIVISTLKDTICRGNTTTFTAVATNGGTSPVFDWRRNGISVGSGSSIDFLGGTLNTSDIISCILTANNSCQTTATAYSNNILLTVKASPVVLQTQSQSGATITSASICTLGSVGTTRYGNLTPYGVWSSSNPSVASVTYNGFVTGNSNGVATISYTIASTNGCIAASNVLVTVAQQATPSATTGNNSICIGTTTALSNNTTTPVGGSAAWSSSNNRGTISNIGVYTGANAGAGEARYTVTNAASCSAYVNYPITVNPTPAVPTIAYAPGTVLTGPTSPFYGAPTGSYCVGKQFTVVGSSNIAGSGVWSATGAASITSGGVVTINAVGAGTVKYTYTSNAGCVNSRTLSASGYTCASRAAISNEQLAISNIDFTMYPNPARSVISLQVDKLIGAGSIVVTDLYGKSVKTQLLSMGTNTVDIAKLSKGMYFVSVITSEGKTTKKLVVE